MTGSIKVKPIIKSTNPILKQVSKPVTDFGEELQILLQDMQLAMMKNGGVGLAAIQIGVAKRVIIIELEETGMTHMVNPEFIRKGNRNVVMTERCLSILGVAKKISRPAKCELKWQDSNGEWQTGNFSGRDARAAQHEMDHLAGILITDYPQI